MTADTLQGITTETTCFSKVQRFIDGTQDSSQQFLQEDIASQLAKQALQALCEILKRTHPRYIRTQQQKQSNEQQNNEKQIQKQQHQQEYLKYLDSMYSLYIQDYESDQIWYQIDSIVEPVMKRVFQQNKHFENIQQVYNNETDQLLSSLISQEQDLDHFNDNQQDANHQNQGQLLNGLNGLNQPLDNQNQVIESHGKDARDSQNTQQQALPQKGNQLQINSTEHILDEIEQNNIIEDKYLNLGDMQKFLDQEEENRDSDYNEQEQEDRDLQELINYSRGNAKQGRGNQKLNKFNQDLVSGKINNDEDIDNDEIDDDEDFDNEEDVDDDEDLDNEDFDDDQDQDTQQDDEEFGMKAQKRQNLPNQRGLQGLDLEDGQGSDEDDLYYQDYFKNNNQLENGTTPIVQGQDKQATKQDLLESEDEDQQDILPSGAEQNKNQSLSTHQKNQQRIQRQIQQLEKDNLGAKDWQYRGEILAKNRPINSILEVNLDYETTNNQPPQPSEENNLTIDSIIRKRILDMRFDDVERVVPPQPQQNKIQDSELDHNKATKGLAQLYEDNYLQKSQPDYVSAQGQKNEKIVLEARQLFNNICAKLDALSNYQFQKPKDLEITQADTIKKLAAKTGVPALAIEENANIITNPNNEIRAPQEVYKNQENGQFRTQNELTRDLRKRLRAKRKRGQGNKNKQQLKDLANTSTSQGGTAQQANRKSLTEREKKVIQKASSRGQPSDKMNYSNMKAVSNKIQKGKDSNNSVQPKQNLKGSQLKLY